MTPDHWNEARIVPYIAILCCVSLIAGVIWSSDRALELTDEAYYLLSAIYPEQILLYISAQHWILAPLWRLTESLQGFRLTGAGLLLGTAAILAIGTLRLLGILTNWKPSLLVYFGVMAAGGIGALLYVATIAPSPSYNLLASAGAYGGLGLTFLAIKQRRISVSFLLCFLAGLCLAISFVNKPSAGVCATLVVFIVTLLLVPGWHKISFAWAGLSGVASTLALLVLMQPTEPSIQYSFTNGLELFRMVQTESIHIRILRYFVTLAESIAKSLVSFWPVVILSAASIFYPRPWLTPLTLCILLLNIIAEKSYLFGMQSYGRAAEAIYVTVIILAVSSFRQWKRNIDVMIVFASLIILPFSVAMGTGNALFTQIIVTLAPWTIAATLLGVMKPENEQADLLQKGLAVLLLTLVSIQILSSYTYQPYHLSAPLIGQTETVSVSSLGTLTVDKATAQMLEDIDAARATCAIASGATFFGLFNVPGLALAFEAIPPVSPWLNNPAQAQAILNHWAPEPAERVIIVLSSEILNETKQLPAALRPEANAYMFCGHSFIPYKAREIEIWASPIDQGT